MGKWRERQEGLEIIIFHLSERDAEGEQAGASETS